VSNQTNSQYERVQDAAVWSACPRLLDDPNSFVRDAVPSASYHRSGEPSLLIVIYYLELGFVIVRVSSTSHASDLVTLSLCATNVYAWKVECRLNGDAIRYPTCLHMSAVIGVAERYKPRRGVDDVICAVLKVAYYDASRGVTWTLDAVASREILQWERVNISMSWQGGSKKRA
jgi:hypothetical protein